MRKRIKENLYKLIGILIILSIAVGWALLSEAWERSAKAEAMDSRELHYDADDDFILIDTQEGLTDAYHFEFVDDRGRRWVLTQIEQEYHGLTNRILMMDLRLSFTDGNNEMELVLRDGREKRR